VIQWYNILQVHIEQQVESALQLLDTRIREYQKSQSAELSTNQLAQSHSPETPSHNPMTPSFPPQPTMQTAMSKCADNQADDVSINPHQFDLVCPGMATLF